MSWISVTEFRYPAGWGTVRDRKERAAEYCRKLEEEGRHLPLHKRNELLHVDAFPSRPTKGGRILRVFTNLNSARPRVWNTSDRFDVLAKQYAMDVGLGRMASRSSFAGAGFFRAATRLLRFAGLPSAKRSAYDQFMLRFHNYLIPERERGISERVPQNPFGVSSARHLDSFYRWRPTCSPFRTIRFGTNVHHSA